MSLPLPPKKVEQIQSTSDCSDIAPFTQLCLRLSLKLTFARCRVAHEVLICVQHCQHSTLVAVIVIREQTLCAGCGSILLCRSPFAFTNIWIFFVFFLRFAISVPRVPRLALLRRSFCSIVSSTFLVLGVCFSLDSTLCGSLLPAFLCLIVRFDGGLTCIVARVRSFVFVTVCFLFAASLLVTASFSSRVNTGLSLLPFALASGTGCALARGFGNT